jgi:hypothetical protein
MLVLDKRTFSRHPELPRSTPRIQGSLHSYNGRAARIIAQNGSKDSRDFFFRSSGGSTRFRISHNAEICIAAGENALPPVTQCIQCAVTAVSVAVRIDSNGKELPHPGPGGVTKPTWKGRREFLRHEGRATASI